MYLFTYLQSSYIICVYIFTELLSHFCPQIKRSNVTLFVFKYLQKGCHIVFTHLKSVISYCINWDTFLLTYLQKHCPIFVFTEPLLHVFVFTETLYQSVYIRWSKFTNAQHIYTLQTKQNKTNASLTASVLCSL